MQVSFEGDLTLVFKGVTPREIRAELNEVHGASFIVFATIERAMFIQKATRRSVYPKINDQISYTVLSDRRIKVRETVHEQFDVKSFFFNGKCIELK